ncbi:hydrogenase nickel incorporation protein [bacterium BMS3Abin15]|nr:hydrogenase nickel incorporation protein [bacterium BMS3Abin15]
MHDFLLAKQIVDEVVKIAKKRNLSNIKKVNLEIGSITLSHDDLPEPSRNASHNEAGRHTEDISLENLEFGLNNIASNTVLKNTEFTLEKMKGANWKITNIEVE